jgi:glycosyltransferase involved in cell wall biosynthesis
MTQKPKILVFGQPFNDITGGGITLSNLFRGWPQDRIAVAATGHVLYYATTDICSIYYQLGKEEHKWIFPFSLMQRSFFSGIKVFKSDAKVSEIRNISSLRFGFVNHVFYPLLSWLGLIHCSSEIILSEKLKNWLSEFRPEILYIQVSNLKTVIFARQLVGYLRIPSAIHIMDDWPSTISTRGIFKCHWKKKIDRELRQLFDCVDLHLSISDAMSDEYYIRYNKKFFAFHNPIDLKVWVPFCKTDFTINRDQIVMLYSGRIGIGIADSIMEVASAVESLNNEGLNIKLHIQTPTEEQSIMNMLNMYHCVTFNKIAEYSELPKIFSSADILLLANDFDNLGISYLKLSMPTKASEYMISGTPILVYAPEEAAVLKILKHNECGYCLSKREETEIMSAIRFLINNEEYRKMISQNSVNYAKRFFDAEKVRTDFQNLIVKLEKTKN